MMSRETASLLYFIDVEQRSHGVTACKNMKPV